MDEKIDSNYVVQYIDQCKSSIKDEENKYKSVELQVALMQTKNERRLTGIERKKETQRLLEDLYGKIKAYGTDEDREKLRASVLSRLDAGMIAAEDEELKTDLERLIEWDRLINGSAEQARAIFYRKK